MALLVKVLISSKNILFKATLRRVFEEIPRYYGLERLIYILDHSRIRKRQKRVMRMT